MRQYVAMHSTTQYGDDMEHFLNDLIGQKEKQSYHSIHLDQS